MSRVGLRVRLQLRLEKQPGPVRREGAALRWGATSSTGWLSSGCSPSGEDLPISSTVIFIATFQTISDKLGRILTAGKLRENAKWK